MARRLRPASIAGIEGDALINEEVSYSADIPEYPVENGYNVSDTIILKPLQLNITLYISDSPATWRSREGHAPSASRTRAVCRKLEDLYFKKVLVKVVTTDKIYTDMGITSMAISHSTEIGYARQVQMSLKKVYVTKRKTVHIPSYILQGGETKANAGAAAVSSSSASSAKPSGDNEGGIAGKKASLLYGIANSLDFL